MSIVTTVPPYEEGIVPYTFNFTPYDRLSDDQLIYFSFTETGNFVPAAAPLATPEPSTWLCLVGSLVVYVIYGLTRGRKSSAYS